MTKELSRRSAPGSDLWSLTLEFQRDWTVRREDQSPERSDGTAVPCYKRLLPRFDSWMLEVTSKQNVTLQRAFPWVKRSRRPGQRKSVEEADRAQLSTRLEGSQAEAARFI